MFIVFEGIDGSGKTTQVKRLIEHFQDTLGIEVVHCRDPGSTPVGWAVREVLQNKELAPSPETDLLLYTACRAELWSKSIEPALSAGKVVICDRFVDSTFAYQIRGKGRDQHEETMVLLHDLFIDAYPDLTILIDVPVEVAAERIAIRNEEKTRFESYNANFFNRVRAGYLEAASNNPANYLVIDGQDAEEAVFNQIIEGLERMAGEDVE